MDLQNASIRLIDSLRIIDGRKKTVMLNTPDVIDYAKIALESVYLKFAARLEPSSTMLRVSEFSFISQHPYFELRNLQGEVSARPTSIHLSKLNVETNGSRFSLDARLGNVAFDEIQTMSNMKDASIDLLLDAHHLSFNELRQFLPTELHFLDQTVGVRAKASGTFGRLNVNEVVLTTPRTFLKVTGSIINLHQPKELTLDLSSRNSLIDPLDLIDYLPGLSIPDLSAFGKISCDLRYTGLPLNFTASFEGTTEKKGGLTVEATMDFREKIPTYKASIRTRDFNVGGVIFDEQIGSQLNARFTIDGSGFKANDMIAVAHGEIDSSVFYDLPFHHSAIVLNVAHGSGRLRSTLRTDHTELEVTGRVDFGEESGLVYSVNAKANSFNLAEILRNNRYDSDLYFNLTASGTGLDYEQMSGLVKIDFLRSRFGREYFDPTSAKLEYKAAGIGTDRYLGLETDFGQLVVNGNFTPISFINAFVRGSTELAEAIRGRLTSLDSLKSPTIETRFRQVQNKSLEAPAFNAIDAQFDLSLVDLYPLGLFLGEHLEGAVKFEGNISRKGNKLNLNGILHSPYFLIGPDGSNLLMQSATLDCDLTLRDHVHILDSLAATLAFNADRTYIGGAKFSSVSANWNINGNTSEYIVRAILDSLLAMEVNGSMSFSPFLYTLNIPTLGFAASDLAFTNAEPVRLVLGRNGFFVDRLTLTNGKESFFVSGLFDPMGHSDLRSHAENVAIGDLKYFFRDKRLAKQFSEIFGTLHAKANFSGTLSDPHINLDLSAQDIQIRETVVGQITARGSLVDGVSNVFLELRTRPGDLSQKPDLLVSGTMPILVRANENEQDKSRQQMNLLVQSQEFSLEFLDPFIPVFSNLTGTLMCDMKIGGTLSDPSYLGSLSVENAQFLFDPLNISYTLDGKLVPQRNKIALEKVILKNLSQDRSDGSVNVTGTFSLEGIRIKEFDLTANGQLLIMKESSVRTRQSLYGDLFGATGQGGIQWRGSPDLSYLSGEVFIKNANLTLPPTRESYLDRQRSIDLVFIDDTSSIETRERAASSVKNARMPRGALSSQIIGPSLTGTGNFEAGRNIEIPRVENETESNFLDNIVYSLAIETMGVTQLRIIVNQITNEMLFADLKGRLFFSKEGKATRLTGEVEVGNRSFYNYIRQFQAAGKLFFRGNPENPELDILAKYEGYHQSASAYGVRDTARIPVEDEKVIVSLEIKGSRQEPKVTMGLIRENATGDRIESSDVQADAISYLVSGKFRDELTPQERTSLFTTSLAGIGSSILSGPLTEFMRREFGFISSVDVLYYGGDVQGATDIRLTGEIGDAVIKFGGRVFSDIGNANVNIQLPMSSLLNSERWRNFIFELERRAAGFEGIDHRKEPTNGVRLLYRISF